VKQGLTIAAEWAGRVAGVNRRLMVTRYGKVYSSKPYKGFRTGLAWAISAAAAGLKLCGPAAVRIQFTVDRARDIDSGVKVVLDSLEDAGVLHDDNQVVRLEVTKLVHRRREEDRVRVEVEPAESSPGCPAGGAAGISPSLPGPG
jgi:Holliday junction resolvase RusA-like endonuclease